MLGARSDGQSIPPMVLAKWEWYRRGAAKHRRGYAVVELTAICVAAAIPLAASLRLDPSIVAVLGALVLIATSVRTTFQPHENWVEFSRLGYDIEREGALFLTGSTPYDGEKAVPALVSRIEDLSLEGGHRWAARRSRLWERDATNPGGALPSPQAGK
jgi:hypothetical protein